MGLRLLFSSKRPVWPPDALLAERSKKKKRKKNDINQKHMSYSANAQDHLFPFTSNGLGWWIQITWQECSELVSMISQRRGTFTDTEKENSFEACLKLRWCCRGSVQQVNREGMKSRAVVDTLNMKPCDVKNEACKTSFYLPSVSQF